MLPLLSSFSDFEWIQNKRRLYVFENKIHDSITKFGKEYNGIYLRGVDCEKCGPFSLPYCLTNVPGAVNSYLLKDVLIETIATFSNAENSALSVINSK